MWPVHWPISDKLFRLQIQNISYQSNFFDDVTHKIGALDFNVNFYKKKIMNHPVLRNRISMDHPVLHNRGTLVHFEAKQNEPPVKIEYAS